MGALVSNEQRDIGKLCHFPGLGPSGEQQDRCEVALLLQSTARNVSACHIYISQARIPCIHSEPGLEASEFYTQPHIQKHFQNRT